MLSYVMKTSTNYNNYNVFFTLYETKSMTKTAEMLGYNSHAGVSKSIKQFEFELGYKLFEITTRTITPTINAEKLYAHAKPLLDSVDNIAANINLLSNNQQTRVKNTINVIAMGGTIDGEISSVGDKVVTLERPIVSSYLRRCVPENTTIIETQITMKDSREINKADIEQLIKTIAQSSFENILVTHGLFTIAKTAQSIKNFFGEHLNGKKIVLIASRLPMLNLAMSDATFNLGFAISSFDHIASGVYIVVDGAIHLTSQNGI